MPWFKVDDLLAMNRKAVHAGNGAMGLWVRAGSWCAQNLTNGHVPLPIARTLGSPAEARRLVAAGLWHEVDGGYEFHDWFEYQPSADEVAKLREDRSAAGRKGAAKRWGRPA